MNRIDRFHFNLARVFLGITVGWAIVGVCCDALILLTTFKTRTLRSTCNILIAVCAIGDILHLSANLVELPLLFGEYLEIDSDICTLLTFLPEMGIAIGCTGILCIGLDRMFAVLFTLRYRAMNNKCYYFISASVLASLIFGICGYNCSLKVAFYRKRTAICEVLTAFPDDGQFWFTFGNFAVNIMSIIVYFVTWIGLRYNSDSTIKKHVIKSLFIVAAVDLSGFFITPGLFLLFDYLSLNAQQMFAWRYFCSIFMHIALYAKLLIYYSTSSEYRAAIDAILFKKAHTGIQNIFFVEGSQEEYECHGHTTHHDFTNQDA